MKSRIIITMILGFSVSLLSLPAQRLKDTVYWIRLTDKNHSSFSISRPDDFLSVRALERRIRYNIPVTEEDLPVSPYYTDSLRSLGFNIKGTSKWFNAVIAESTDSLLLDTLSHISFVKDFSIEYTSFSSDVQENTESLTGWYSDIGLSAYGESEKQLDILGGVNLHFMGYQGQGMQIAVLDAGFENVDVVSAFDPLFAENRILAVRDFVNPSGDIFHESSHGRNVLSTMAAFVPDVFIGTAPKASYYLLRSEDARSETKIEEAYWAIAAEFADSAGADIITSSLGYYKFDHPEMNYLWDDLTGESALVTRAAEKAFSKGMIVVASAGNEGDDEWMKITPPADGRNVIAVGSIDTALSITSFSSRGYTADGRIKPDVLAVGYKTSIINSAGDPGIGYGTSFAAPQVAGLLACLWQAVPGKTNLEIIEALRRNASRFTNPDSISGYGIPDFSNMLWDLLSEEFLLPKNMVNIFPNPFNSEFEIELLNPQNKISDLRIFSSDGKLLYSNSKILNNSETLRIENLNKIPPGMYVVVLNTSDNQIVTKLIKQ